MKHNNRFLIGIALLIVICTIDAQDTVHRYHAPAFFGEPRIERDRLCSIDVQIGGGHTKESRNSHGKLVPLFDIFGTTNIQNLGLSVSQDATRPAEILLKNLASLPQRDLFGHFSISGAFEYTEATIALCQNIIHGFFMRFFLPIRKFNIDNIQYIDLSPQDDIFPNRNTPDWQAVVQNLDTILSNYQLTGDPVQTKGIGDLTLGIGWTHNYQETKHLDFIDITLHTGILIPTGKKNNPDAIFSIPLGYNGNLGFPFGLELAFGAYEWLTLGCFVQGIGFVSRKSQTRLFTHHRDQGMIALYKDRASIQHGTIWQTGYYIKADHFSRGLSVTGGYSFSCQRAAHIHTTDQAHFPAAVTRDTAQLRGFCLHTLHINAEYDFTQQNWLLGPRIGVSWNKQLKGKRTYNADYTTGTFGLEIMVAY